MMWLIIDKDRCGNFIIRADGHRAIKYMFYSKKAAIAKYRKDENLVGKHLHTIEI